MTKKENKILIVRVRVEDKLEAYKVVTDLAFEHEILNADFNGHKEDFDKKNTPFHFLKNNKKNKKIFRDIRAERIKK